MDETNLEHTPKATIPSEPEMEVCARPACEWLGEVESLIKTLSAQRQEVRRKMRVEQEQLRAIHPRAEARFFSRDERERAKAAVLGPDWQRASERIHQARQRVLSARRQLQTLTSAARARRESSPKWAYWLLYVPHYGWKMRPLKKRLRQANLQRREALKTVRGVRPLLVQPEIRSRIFRLTEDLRLGAERLTQSIQSRNELDQRITAMLSPALRLSPRLRDLGSEPVTMKRPKDPEMRTTVPPIPIEPLCAPRQAEHLGRGLRVH